MIAAAAAAATIAAARRSSMDIFLVPSVLNIFQDIPMICSLHFLNFFSMSVWGVSMFFFLFSIFFLHSDFLFDNNCKKSFRDSTYLSCLTI